MERLLDFFIPEHYKLELSFDKPAKLIHGKVVIDGRSKADRIKFHAKDMEFHSVFVDNDEVPADLMKYDGAILEIPQASIINIDFTAKISETMLGCYASTYQYEGREETIIATQFESNYAQKAFPCIDEPAAKAAFDVTIITDPTDTVISNMPALSSDNGVTKFDTTPRMSTYLLVWVIGKFNKYEITTLGDITVTAYSALNQPASLLEYPAKITAGCIQYFTEKFHSIYPLPKLDLIALPDFDAGAMENWGLMTFRESCMLADESSSLDAKHLVALVVAHEVSHQWFGDLVTMKWWDDLWLNESFASLIEYFAVDHLYPDFRIWDDFYTSSIMVSLSRDDLPGVQAVHQDVNNPDEISTLFDPAIVYAKGAHLLLMLVRLMGEDQFFRGCADYFNLHQYQNTTSDDLWESLTPYADFDVKDFMTPWLVQPGFPVLTGGEQTRFLINDTTDDLKYPVPEIRDDLSGHYLINLTDEQLHAKLEQFDTLSTEQKLRLLIDRSLLAKTHFASSASLISLIQRLASDTSYVIWDLISILLSDLKTFIDPGTEAETDFKALIRSVITPHADRLGIAAKEGETLDDTQLRPLILCYSAYVGYEPIVDAAIDLYKTKSINDLDPNIRSSILVAQVKNRETPTLIKQLLENYRTATDPNLKADIMLALTASTKPATLKKILECIKDSALVRPQDIDRTWIYVLRNSFGTDIAIDWLIKNWDFVAKMSADQGLDDYPEALGGVIRKSAQRDKFLKFFSPLKNHPQLTRAIDVATPQIDARLALITSDGPEVVETLKNLPK